jgi:hypothetical protein
MQLTSNATVYLLFSNSNKRAAHEVLVDVSLQHYLAALENLTEPGLEPVEHLVGKLDRRSKLDLHFPLVLLDEIFVARHHILKELRATVVDEDLEEVPRRGGHLLRQGVYSPPLLTFGDVGPVEELPEFITLVENTHKLFEVLQGLFDLFALTCGFEEGLGVGGYRAQTLPAIPGASPGNLVLEFIERTGDQTLVLVAVYGAAEDLLGGLYDHASDFLTHLP